MAPSSRLVAASIRITPSPPAATQTLPPATAMPAGPSGRSLSTATTRLLARSMRATAPRPVATHPAPAPTATCDGRKRRSPGANSNGNGPSLILATTRPVPGSRRTTSSVSGCTTQIVPAPTARSAGFGPPAGKRATTRLERGSTRTTWWSRHAPTHRLPAANTSGPPPWPTSICAVAQRSGRVSCWGGGAGVGVGVGGDHDAGAWGLAMRPATASTATAPSTAAPTRSLSRCEAMGSTSPVTNPQSHRVHAIPVAERPVLLPTRPSYDEWALAGPRAAGGGVRGEAPSPRDTGHQARPGTRGAAAAPLPQSQARWDGRARRLLDQAPPKAAPHSRRVWPHTLIALDRY